VHREVSPGYFRTMGVPLVAGRDFTDHDRRGAEFVVVINRALADRYFAGQDPVGQFIAFDRKPDSTSLWRRIVGVVGNEAQKSLGTPPQIEIFASLAQDPRARVHLVARTRSDPATLLRATEGTIRRLDPSMGIPASVTMDDLRRESLARERFLAALLLAFAGVGTVLAIVGSTWSPSQSGHARDRSGWRWGAGGRALAGRPARRPLTVLGITAGAAPRCSAARPPAPVWRDAIRCGHVRRCPPCLLACCLIPAVRTLLRAR
jgi:putative ABC transport system permease protein